MTEKKMDGERAGSRLRYRLPDFKSRLLECDFTLRIPLPNLPSETSNLKGFFSSARGEEVLRIFGEFRQAKLPPGRLPEGASVRYPGGRQGKAPFHIEASQTGRFRGKGRKPREKRQSFTYRGPEVLGWILDSEKLMDLSGLELPKVEPLGIQLPLITQEERRAPRPQKIDRRLAVLKAAVGGGAVAVGLAACAPQTPPAIVTETPIGEASATPTIISITPSPEIRPSSTPTKKAQVETPTVVVSDTVVVSEAGFGGEDVKELTLEEQGELEHLGENYKALAREHNIGGVVFPSYGWRGVGAYLEADDGSRWLLVGQEESYRLEEVPDYQGVKPEWSPDWKRFEATDTQGRVFAWNPEDRSWKEVTTEVSRGSWIKDDFAGTNRLNFQGPSPHFENSALIFTAPENGTWLFSSRSIPLTNFRLEARITGDGDYGLNFGDSRESQINYDLILFRNGELVLNLHQGGEFLGPLFSERVLSRSEVGGFHNFGLEYNGKVLEIFFEGQKVGEVSRAMLRDGLETAGANGQIGLHCWDEGQKNVEVGIDSLEILLPKELIPIILTPTPLEEKPSPETCPSGSEAIPPEIGRYQHGEPSELVQANASRFSPIEIRFLGGREAIFFGAGRITKIDLSSETITAETLSGTFTLRFSSQTLFALFDTNTWNWLDTDQCKLRTGDVVRIYVEAPNDGAFLTGIWK